MKFYKAIKGKARKELKMKYMTANEIAEALRSTDTWDAELCDALCEEAGMTANGKPQTATPLKVWSKLLPPSWELRFTASSVSPLL